MSYPPSGPPPGPFDPQQPYGQPPGPYPQNPYQYQQPQWGSQGGFPPGPPPPPKRRTGLVVSLVVVAVLVLGGGAAAFFLLRDGGGGSGGDDTGDARAAADSYVREFEKALNTDVADVDLAPLRPYACDQDFTQLDSTLRDAKQAAEGSGGSGRVEEVRMELRDYQDTSDGGTFTLVLIEVEDDDNEETKNMTVAQENGDWKVCGLYADEQSGGQEPTRGERPTGAEDDPVGEVPPNPIPTT